MAREREEEPCAFGFSILLSCITLVAQRGEDVRCKSRKSLGPITMEAKGLIPMLVEVQEA